MALITLPPGCAFEDAQLTLSRKSVAARSSYTGKRQVSRLSYALWVFEGRMPSLSQEAAAPWRSFLARLEGQVNTFKLPVPGVAGPLSRYSGAVGKPAAPLSGVGASSVYTNGWQPNTLLLKDGDYFNIENELKLCTADVMSNASGQATILFAPPLRRTATTGDILELQAPFVVVSAQNDDIASWALSKPVQHKISVALIEDIG